MWVQHRFCSVLLAKAGTHPAISRSFARIWRDRPRDERKRRVCEHHGSRLSPGKGNGGVDSERDPRIGSVSCGPRAAFRVAGRRRSVLGAICRNCSTSLTATKAADRSIVEIDTGLRGALRGRIVRHSRQRYRRESTGCDSGARLANSDPRQGAHGAGRPAFSWRSCSFLSSSGCFMRCRRGNAAR